MQRTAVMCKSASSRVARAFLAALAGRAATKYMRVMRGESGKSVFGSPKPAEKRATFPNFRFLDRVCPDFLLRSRA